MPQTRPKKPPWPKVPVMATSWAEKTISGTWQARYRTPDGKRWGAGTHPTKKQAERAAAIALHEHNPAGNPNIEDLAADWLSTREGKRSTSTVKTNKTHISARIVPYWGETFIQDVTPGDVEDYVSHLIREGYSPTSVTHTIATLKMVFGRALKKGYIRSNPAIGVELPSPGRSPDRYITREEYAAISAALPRDSYTRPFTDILVGTGLRVGELLGLHWENVDFDNELIQVVMAFNNTTREMKTVKNHLNRSVPIAPPVRSSLIEMRARGPYPGELAHGAIYLDQPYPHTGPVFTSKLRGPASIDVIRREWSAACRVARVGDIPVGNVRLGDLRHTAASWMLQAGISLEQVQVFLGHQSIKTTERYARFGKQDWTAAKRILTYRDDSIRDFYYMQQDMINRGELTRDRDMPDGALD